MIEAGLDSQEKKRETMALRDISSSHKTNALAVRLAEYDPPMSRPTVVQSCCTKKDKQRLCTQYRLCKKVVLVCAFRFDLNGSLDQVVGLIGSQKATNGKTRMALIMRLAMVMMDLLRYTKWMV